MGALADNRASNKAWRVARVSPRDHAAEGAPRVPLANFPPGTHAKRAGRPGSLLVAKPITRTGLVTCRRDSGRQGHLQLSVRGPEEAVADVVCVDEVAGHVAGVGELDGDGALEDTGAGVGRVNVE